MEVLSKLLSSNSLCRSRSSIFSSSKNRPQFCVVLHAGMTPKQAAAHRDVLIRCYPLLVEDGEQARHSSGRYAQLRDAMNDLVEVSSCFELAEVEDDPSTSLPAVDISASGKLQLLDQILAHLHGAGRRVLLLSQRPRIVRALQVYARARFGSDGLAVIHQDIGSVERHKAIKRINRSGSHVWLVLHETSCLGIGTDLSKLDAVIIFDSEMSAIGDLSALARPLRLSKDSPPAVVRLIAGPAEERLAEVQGASAHAAEGLLRALPGSSTSVACDLLDGIFHHSAEMLLEGTPGAIRPTSSYILPEKVVAAIMAAAFSPKADEAKNCLGGVSAGLAHVVDMPLSHSAAEAAIGLWDEHHMPEIDVAVPLDGGFTLQAGSAQDLAAFWRSHLHERSVPSNLLD